MLLAKILHTKEVMEALWNLEDKWKLTTQEALILVACSGVAVIGLCMATVLKMKAQRKEIVGRDEGVNGSIHVKWTEPSGNWVSIKRILKSSVRWSGAKKWEERGVGGWKEGAPPLLDFHKGCEGSVGWQSHNSDSPVWQRPILMGEKCELPRFSGLILYDETGRPLDNSFEKTSHKDAAIHQEKPAAVVKTTLRDLL